MADQKLLDAKDPFGGNVLKNPARYIYHCYGCTLRIVYHYANPLTLFLARDAFKLVPYLGKNNSVLSDCMVKKP